MIETEASAIAQAISDNKDRLGLSWQMRLGTMDGNGLAVLDGDTSTIPVSCINSTPTAGTRIWVAETPGGVCYVLGQVAQPPGGDLTNGAARSVIRDTTVAFAAETTIDSISIALLKGETYTAENWAHYESTAANEVIVHRIRVDGTLFQQQTLIPTHAASNTYGNFSKTVIIPLRTATFLVTATMERVTALGNCISFGNGSSQYRNYIRVKHDMAT